MNNNSTNKKYKRPKQKTPSTTNPASSRQGNKVPKGNKPPETIFPLAAKDSEWVDILQTETPATGSATSSNVTEEEEVLQLVECEDGPQMKPLAIMFPGLLEKDPNTLEGVLNKVMSTTEVTKHLVDLGQKANFTFMKKADRLIPRDKQWLESLTENSNSLSSMASVLFSSSVSSDYDAENDVTFGLGDEKYVDESKQANEIKSDANCNLHRINSSYNMTAEQTLLEIDQENGTTSQTKISTDSEDID